MPGFRLELKPLTAARFPQDADVSESKGGGKPVSFEADCLIQAYRRYRAGWENGKHYRTNDEVLDVICNLFRLGICLLAALST